LKIGQVPIPLTENTHVFLTAGYVFKVSEQFKFKPALMSKYVSGVSLMSLQMFCTMKIWVWSSISTWDSVSAMMNVKLHPVFVLSTLMITTPLA
jgi:hypothetical protein